MGFFYYSTLSIVPLGIAYVLLALIYWGLVRVTRRIRGRSIVLSVAGALFLLLPISEELWIAWNFGQACKDAGTVISKKVQVEGFYDDTRATHAGPPTAQAVESFEKSGYRFLEMKGREKFVRVEKIDGQWKSSVVDRPTARYHFRNTDPMGGTPWAHKVVRYGSSVVDTEKNAEIARYTRFARRPPWFFIGLDRPDFACDEPGRWPLARGDFLIFESTLQPVMEK